jgi:diphosphomevalonate decarboxylase
MKITSIAHSNIALIKFFGKSDNNLRIPTNNSLSMSLSAVTMTTVEFSDNYPEDGIQMIGETLSEIEKNRIIRHLDRIRKIANKNLSAKVVTQNSFPKSTGIASSASGFAALTVAGTKAIGLDMSEKELSTLARLASGSACRSIPSGYVEWEKGNSHETSFAHSIYPPGYWDLRDLVVVVEKSPKKISTSAVHEMAKTSPFFVKRLTGMDEKIKCLKNAFDKKNFEMFGEIVEHEAFNMHAVMMTMNPPVIYWTPQTVEIIMGIHNLRAQKIPVYFTLDAGPNVHCICEGKYEKQILSYLKRMKNIQEIIVNHPGEGAYLSEGHLF